jgi:hypothetical protein
LVIQTLHVSPLKDTFQNKCNGFITRKMVFPLNECITQKISSSTWKHPVYLSQPGDSVGYSCEYQTTNWKVFGNSYFACCPSKPKNISGLKITDI